MNSISELVSMPDVQGAYDRRAIALDQVGIKRLRYPIAIRARDGTVVSTVAYFSMSIALASDRKGAHMSRFIQALESSSRVFDPEAFATFASEMVQRLEADAGQVEVTFPYFRRKRAPVSGIESLMDYEVSLVARVRASAVALSTKIVVPVTSLCPCSRDISEYGAHNQRSHITLTVEGALLPTIDTLINVAESSASSELYAVLKRTDEKFVTERAYDNPRFVEDLIRELAIRMDADTSIDRYAIEVENFESIHNHSAFASVARTREPR
jgi:GTP cyclohydrolase IB